VQHMAVAMKNTSTGRTPRRGMITEHIVLSGSSTSSNAATDAAEVHGHLVDLVGMMTGFFVPAFFIIWMSWPGSAPM